MDNLNFTLEAGSPSGTSIWIPPTSCPAESTFLLSGHISGSSVMRCGGRSSCDLAPAASPCFSWPDHWLCASPHAVVYAEPLVPPGLEPCSSLFGLRVALLLFLLVSGPCYLSWTSQSWVPTYPGSGVSLISNSLILLPARTGCVTKLWSYHMGKKFPCSTECHLIHFT